MTSKVYKTAQGKIVDLGALQAQNEHVRAVGNMQVNARGDRIDANGQVISTRAQQVNRNLDRTTSAVSEPVPRAKTEAELAAARAVQEEKIEKARAHRQTMREQGVAPTVEQPAAGLAAAMARASKIKDEE
jgi:ribosome assembly protein YihI (activator of Der GTPase)